MPFFKGEVEESPRKGFLYWSDDGDIFAIRVGRWKTVFLEQNHEGLDIWRLGFEKLRAPKIFDLLADPFERGDSSLLYDQWQIHHAYIDLRGQGVKKADRRDKDSSRLVPRRMELYNSSE
jgi:arylsulfatase A-like enzyme